MTEYEVQVRVQGPAFVLPLLVFPLCELPTETLTLPVREPCYRRMFEAVECSASRAFGVVLADPGSRSMESVGALCELTHSIAVPEQQLQLVTARVVGRFQTQAVLCSEPFVAVLAREYSDNMPQDGFEALQLAAQEQRVWKELLQVFALEDKLCDLLSGRLAAKLSALSENLEILRWSPSAAARASVPTAPGNDTAMLAEVGAEGLLGDPHTLAERTSEHLCSDAARYVSEDGRRERFSFALASSLGLDQQQQQSLLYSQSMAERLRAVEEVLVEWRRHLAACSALHDTLPPGQGQ